GAAAGLSRRPHLRGDDHVGRSHPLPQGPEPALSLHRARIECCTEQAWPVTETIVEFLRRWGELSPTSAVVLALVFVAGGLVPVPRTFLTLAAGVVYGMAAVPIIMPATTLGSLIPFVIAPYLFARPRPPTIPPRPTP